ncbi:Crp/Fnr family transcriptional regulator [Rhodoferax sp.]|jgi:CRP-like cAMP-binding protein|uniref:Crp/Fnr family transcriptional regulator n=1 Tax=Rhodoferax sp. TaxID=50421 RepID=UPI0025DAA826|nr:Crp/Fnr family transcriptional regulator [Rhodoferax sp.]
MIPLDTFDMPRFLARSAFFSAMSADELQRMASACQIKRFPKGDMIFRTGEPCDAFHIVVDGEVKLFVSSAAGHEKVVEIACAGQSFGEGMMFLDKPCILNARTLTDVVLVVVSKQGVFLEVAQDPRFAMHMLAGISRRLHGLIQDVQSYALHNGMQRLIGFLLRDVDTNAQAVGTFTVTLPASKATIASRLSLTPEYFSRVLHELESIQLIQIDKRDIHIADVQRLASHGAT